MVLETTFRSSTGEARLVDTLALGADSTGHRLGAGAPHLLIRELSGVRGAVEFEVSYAPRLEYGLIAPLLSPVPGGLTARGGAEWLVLTSPVPLSVHGSTATARVSVRGGDARLRLAPLDTGAAAAPRVVAGRAARAAGGDGRRLAPVVGPAPDLRRTVARAGAPQRAGAPGAHLPAERRDRRRGEHVAAGERRRRTELGLPVQLGARREPDDGGAVGRRVPGRGQRLLRLHDDRRRGLSRRRRTAADHVRGWWRARPHRTHACPPDRVARQPAGADWQRRVDPAAGRRVRRVARRRVPPRRPDRRRRRGHPSVSRRRRGRRRDPLAGDRPGHLGGSGRASALPLLEGDVLGRAGPGDRPGRPARRGRQGRCLEAEPERHLGDRGPRGVERFGSARSPSRSDPKTWTPPP